MFNWMRRYFKKYRNDPTHCDKCGWDFNGYGPCPDCKGKVRFRKGIEGPQWRNPQIEESDDVQSN